MFYATNGDERIMATPKADALCPTCGEPVIAKCGDIVTWHWAHRAGRDCDDWAEGETEWHLQWKARFKNAEVTIKRGDEWHRADVQTDTGWVIEFQHSPISLGEIQRRERFYKRMIWVFDATGSRAEDWAGATRLTLYACDDNRAEQGYCTFRWKHARKSIAGADSVVYLDLGEGWLLRIGKIYFDDVCAGWGHAVSYQDFLRIEAGNERPTQIQQRTI